MIKSILFLTVLGLIQAAVQAQVAVDDSCEYLDNGCPADFNIHKLLPHETSCRKFYYCANGVRVLRKCPRGTVFLAELPSCHPPIDDRICEDDDSSSEPSTEEVQSSEEIERHPNGCPVDWAYSTYLPHNNYCNKYYQCTFGMLFERRCAPGTRFNPEIQQCDHSSVVVCTLAGGDASSSEEQPEVPEVPVTTSERPIDVHANGCPKDGYINWLLPHENDCNQFYHCVWGTRIPARCPGALHFSLDLQRCESPAIAGCVCATRNC